MDNKEILNQQTQRVEQMKNGVIEQMQCLGAAAILWGENLFGSTSYPLLADADGRNHDVHGLYLTKDGVLKALIAYPGGQQITGVKLLSPQKAAEVITPQMVLDGGIPEEWAVLCDSFEVAAQVLKAQKDEDAPQAWW